MNRAFTNKQFDKHTTGRVIDIQGLIDDDTVIANQSMGVTGLQVKLPYCRQKVFKANLLQAVKKLSGKTQSAVLMLLSSITIATAS